MRQPFWYRPNGSWLNLPLQPINTVNLAEVVTKQSATGISETAIQKILMLLNLTIIPFADLMAYEELERLEEIFGVSCEIVVGACVDFGSDVPSNDGKY